MSDVSLRGKLLVANPTMADPNFSRRVVLVLAHALDGGALGVVLNRPSSAGLGSGFAAWDARAPEPGVVFLGGPVSPDSIIGVGLMGPGRIAEAPREDPGFRSGDPFSEVIFAPIRGRLATVDLTLDPEASGVERLRVFAGYAGWGPGQLEDEIAAGAWIVAEALPQDVFSVAPESLWEDVLRRQRGEVAFLAAYPDDPTLN